MFAKNDPESAGRGEDLKSASLGPRPPQRPNDPILTVAKESLKKYLNAVEDIPHYDIGFGRNEENGIYIRVRFYGPMPENIELPAESEGVPVLYGANQKPARPR